MRPEGLKTRIFLDGGNPHETEEIIRLLGFLDGQTTNPTLISKNPKVRKRLEEGKKFSKDEIFDFYRSAVEEIYSLIPEGSISIEVYADSHTSSQEMLRQGERMSSWLQNAHIKFPSSIEGLKSAEKAVKEGLRVKNMTLCFSQEQAAAVYAATSGAKKGDVFVSPFIGRLDDRGENGMDLIANILRMFQKGDGHVEVLTASVRKLDHLLYAIELGSDIVTAPSGVLKEWAKNGLPMPGNEYIYDSGNLQSITYRQVDLTKKWNKYDIHHDLTVRGMERFSEDWNSLISSR